MSDCKHSFDDEGDCVACGAFIEDLDDGAVERIAELEAQLPRWIPVSERLPEYGKLVLTLSDFDVAIDYLKTSDKFTSEHPTDAGMPVTHWMPLPLPPAPEGE